MLYEDVNFEPLGDYLLVETLPKNETDGGIALPDGVLTGPERGRVVRAGPGRITEEGALIPMTVKPGDLIYVICSYQKPTFFPWKGKEFAIIRQRDVCGTTEKPKEEETVVLTLTKQTDAELAA